MNDRIDEVSGVEERPQGRREWSGVIGSLLIPVLLVVAIVGVLLWFDRVRDSGGDGAAGPYGIVELPAGFNDTGESASSDVGRAAPDFYLETPDGGTLRLSDLRGSPVLVNFWASWCQPCRQEMPEIVEAWRRPGTGVIVVGVNLQENADIVREFSSEFGMGFPVVIDRNGQVAESWRIGGPIEGIPSSYFIDAEGIVRARHFGPLTSEQLDEALAEIVDG